MQKHLVIYSNDITNRTSRLPQEIVKFVAKIGKFWQKMKAKTKHIWYVIDNPNDRFAKILKMDVSQIEPFQVVE